MSDTQDDPFDKEAEKEKLRQQLADEAADREATQHMSELLLQGATMTNRHCDNCGDPLFRQGDRAFCPTCGREAAPAGADEAASDQAAAEAAVDGGAAAGTAAAGQPTTEVSQGADRPSPSTDQRAAGAADLPAAREALARKVTALAQEAEATTDVGRARELLAAVREGAEALRALEGTGR